MTSDQGALTGRERPVPEGGGRGGGPARRPPGRRRLLRVLLWGLAVVVLLPLGLAALLLAGLQTQGGRDLLRDLIVSQVEGPGTRIAIGRISGAPPGRLVVEDLAVADARGVWLRGDRILLAWSPLALLGGTLEVETLEAGRVELARLPAGDAPPEPAPEGFSLPTLPLALELERLAVGELALGAAVLGEPLALSVEAALAAERAGRVVSRLTVAEAGGGGSIEAEASYRLSDRHLEASLQASAPAGGRVSRVSGLPGAPALALSLEGAGALPGWRARWRAEAAPVATAEGRLGLESLQPLSLLLEGRAEPGPEFPAEAAPWLRPALTFDLAAGYDAGAETATLAIRELSSSALTASGRADAALAEDAADAELALRLREAAPLQALAPGLAVRDAGIEARARKRGDEVAITLQGELERVLLADPDAPGGGLGFERVALTLDSGARSLAAPLAEGEAAHLAVTAEGPLGDPALTAALDHTTTLEAEVVPGPEALRVEELALTSGSLRLTGAGRYRLSGTAAGSAEVEATLEESDLARLSGLAGLPLEGRATLTLDASLQADGGGRAELAAEAAGFGLDVPAVQALLGARPSLRLTATRSGDGPIHVEQAELTGTPVATAEGELVPLRLRAQGTLAPAAGQLDATATLALPRLAVLQAADLPLSGAATLDLAVFGALEAPEAVWALRGETLSYDGRRVADLQVDGTTSGLPAAPRGEVELGAATGSGALRGGFGYALTEQTLRLDGLSLSRGGDSLAGALTAQLEQGTATGELTLSLGELSAYRALTGLDLAGSAELAVALSAPEGRQQARLSGEAADLRLDDLRLGRLVVEATGRDLTGDPALQGSVSARDLAAPDLRLSELSAELEGDLERLSVQASLTGEAALAGEDGGRALAASATAELGLEGATRIRLTGLDASLGEERLALSAPAEILLDGDRTRVEGLALSLAGGTLSLDADMRPGSIEAELQASDLPLRLVRLAAPELEPSGTLDVAVSLAGPPPRPSGTLSLAGRGLQIGTAEVPPLELRLDGTLNDGRLSAEGRLSGFAERPLLLQVGLPLLVSATPPSLSVPQDEPLRLDADWDGQLEQLMAILPIDAVRFGGRGTVDLAVRGTLAAPETAGSVSVEEGFYENYTLGMRLDPVTLQLDGSGRRLELERFSGRDSEGGSMNAEGFIDLSGGVPRFDLRFRADDAHIARRDDVSGALDAELSLEGSTEGADLSGELRTRPTEVRLINALPPSVTELEVVEVTGDGAPPEPAEEAAGADQPSGVGGLGWLALGVDVEIPGQLFVRGRGLDSEWQGTLRIGGTAEQPRIQGSLSPVRGTFDFAGRVFRLDPDSTIRFLGSPSPDPELDLTATYQGSELLASILVSGTVSDPELDLTSSPPLPDDEILSRVLFGKSSGQLSAAEALQLAQAADTLRGGGGEGLMGVVRRTLGVDVLSFAPGDSGSDVGSLRIGKYVTDDVFVGAEQGTTSGSSAAIVEWEITPNISLESEVGADSRSNATINWKWDY